MIIGLIILNGILVASGVLVFRSIRADARRSDAAHPCQRVDMRDVPGRRSPLIELTLQLVFVDLEDDAVVLDCVITDEDTTIGPAGWPLTVRVCRPFDSSAVGWMCEVLRQWAAESSVVRLTFRNGAYRSRVSITDGATTLHFDPASIDGGQPRDVWPSDGAQSS